MNDLNGRSLWGKQRQHYVPRLLLQRFTFNGEQTSVYDLQRNTCFTAGMRDIASEKGFSDYIDSDGGRQTIEQWLGSEIEKPGSVAIRNLVEGRNINGLSAQDKLALARFVAVQCVRTKVIREDELTFPANLLRILERSGPIADSLRAQLEDASPNDAYIVHVNLIVKIATIGRILAARTWTLMLPPAGREFCTSDNPVLRFNPNDCEPYGNLGILCKGIQLWLALSPTLCLVIIEPTYCGSNLPHIQNLEPKHLLHYNGLLASQAFRFLFSKSGDFEVSPGMYSGGRSIYGWPDETDDIAEE